jgi:uncharacterized protein
MRSLLRLLPFIFIPTLFACLTINIYFPAEEVRGAADRIVDEVWSERVQPPVRQEAPPPAAPSNPGSSFWRLGTSSAHAAQDIDITTPEIRALREAMRQRAEALFPYLDRGQVGLSHDGLLKVRTSEGLDLKGRGEVSRLVKAENEDRQRLYREIARANGFPEQAAEVQAIFAESWRQRASAGWYLEGADGSWRRK